MDYQLHVQVIEFPASVERYACVTLNTPKASEESGVGQKLLHSLN